MNFNRRRRSPSANEWKNEKIFFTCFRFGWRSLSTSTRRIHNFSLPNKHRLSRANEIIFSVNENKLSERTVEVFFLFFCFPRRVGIQHEQHNSQVGLGWVIFHCEKNEKENFFPATTVATLSAKEEDWVSAYLSVLEVDWGLKCYLMQSSHSSRVH